MLVASEGSKDKDVKVAYSASILFNIFSLQV